MKIAGRFLAGIMAVVLLSGEMHAGTVSAANGAGEVSSYEIDGFMLEGYTTDYFGSDADVSGKRIHWVNIENEAGVSLGYKVYKYDSKKNVKKIIEHRTDGSVVAETVYVYDKNKNLKKATKTDAGGLVDRLVRDTDSDGHLIRESHYNKNGEYQYSTYEHKGKRVVKQIRVRSANGGAKERIRYKYNYADNVTSVTGGGCNCKFVYDSDERLIRARVRKDGGARQKYKCTYDGDGYLSKMTVESGTARYLQVFHYKTRR